MIVTFDNKNAKKTKLFKDLTAREAFKIKGDSFPSIFLGHSDRNDAKTYMFIIFAEDGPHFREVSSAESHWLNAEVELVELEMNLRY